MLQQIGENLKKTMSSEELENLEKFKNQFKSEVFYQTDAGDHLSFDPKTEIWKIKKQNAYYWKELLIRKIVQFNTVYSLELVVWNSPLRLKYSIIVGDNTVTFARFGNKKDQIFWRNSRKTDYVRPLKILKPSNKMIKAIPGAYISEVSV